jgi:hypothetical protein
MQSENMRIKLMEYLNLEDQVVVQHFVNYTT